jgi:hypothetical protein
MVTAVISVGSKRFDRGVCLDVGNPFSEVQIETWGVGRLAAALLPVEVAREVGEDVGRVAEAMTQHQAGWGSIYLDLLVQRVEGGAGEVPSFELLDLSVVPATQQALRTLNSLLVDTEFALLAASVVR